MTSPSGSWESRTTTPAAVGATSTHAPLLILRCALRQARGGSSSPRISCLSVRASHGYQTWVPFLDYGPPTSPAGAAALLYTAEIPIIKSIDSFGLNAISHKRSNTMESR